MAVICSECSFHSLNTRTLDDGRIIYKMYRVDLSDHSSCVCIAAHDDLSAGRTFRWETFLSPRLWLEQRATLLAYLAEMHYPAPRVMLSLRGDRVISEGPWHLLLTTWIPGQAEEISPEHLRLLGSTLGRLHRLPISEEVGMYRLMACHQPQPHFLFSDDGGLLPF